MLDPLVSVPSSPYQELQWTQSVSITNNEDRNGETKEQ
jgi:hypothetical protein